MPVLSGKQSPMKRRRQRGSALIEFSMMILPLLACVFMTLDLAWILFTWACIQEGVREGVRFAVTGQVLQGYACQDASIRAVIQMTSIGFVNATNAASVVQIQYYDPLTLQPLNGVGSNAGGNVIKITVSQITVGTFGPIFRTWTPIKLGASSSDVMEGSPGGVPPCR